MDEKKKNFSHLIRVKWCKGCGICVAFCPKKVLALHDGKVAAERPEDCIGCRMCELRCPDYAIEIHEAGEKKAEDSTPPDLTLPPEALDA